MNRVLVSLLAVVSSVLLLSTPAFATKGIDAARTCNATPRCVLVFEDDGGIIIQMGGTIIVCPGPQSECKVLGIRATSGQGTSVTGDPATR